MKLDFSKKNTFNQIHPKNEFEIKVFQFLKEWFSDSLTVTVQTSGSTGTPKILEIDKSKMVHSAKMTCNFFDLKPGNSALLCLPVEYISGKMMIVRAIERQLQLTVVTPSAQPLKNIDDSFDFCAMSPLQVEKSLDKIHLIHNLIIGGAAVSPSLINKINEKFESQQVHPLPKIFETFGMSETLSHIALKEIFPHSKEYFSPLENVKISQDVNGGLLLDVPFLHEEIISTNDLVEINTQQEFRFLGRLDHVINSGGLKIFPEELERLVKNVISNEVVFLGIKDETLGEKLHLIIEGKKDNSILDRLNEIQYPSKNHRPKEIIFVPEFPRTPNGKINRLDLRTLINQNKS